jgi:hypothetical protein
MKIFFILSCLVFSTILKAQKMPIVHANSSKASLREGAEYKENEWTIVPEAKPDIWNVTVAKGSKKRVTFVTDIDSISFMVEGGKTYDFCVVVMGKDSAYTRITTNPEAASFSKSYIKKYNNKTVIEVPEAYELTNIVLALTKLGISDSDLVNHNTHYYADVMNWFGEYKNETIVLKIDSLVQKDIFKYFYLKMDAYSFDMDKNKVVRSDIYDRTSWGQENTLLPYMKELEQFANKTRFRDFYSKHKGLYKSQIAYYKDSLDLESMQGWLNKHFPKTSYNCVKVIFSPLVGGNQSVKTMENNGFSEVHTHVNFPYEEDGDKAYTAKVNKVISGNVVFTELNHAYINPETEKYLNDSNFQIAFKDLSIWEADSSAATLGYGNAFACFNEYMNWGLVSLRYMDYLTEQERAPAISRLERHITKVRGFTKFTEFNQHLMMLYKNRRAGTTLAALYPDIIKWCKGQVIAKQ